MQTGGRQDSDDKINIRFSKFSNAATNWHFREDLREKQKTVREDVYYYDSH
jgi:hypothetical protein